MRPNVHNPLYSVRDLRGSDPKRLASRRALIIDRRAVTGTEICRSLARRGYAADVAGEVTSPAFYSRFCSRRLVTPPLLSGEPFIAALRRILRGCDYDAIFVCNEEILDTLMRLPEFDTLRGLVRPARKKALETALGKHAMCALAGGAGVAIPRTLFPNDERELDSAALELGYPMMVKGDRGEGGERVRLVHNRRQLIEAWRELLALEWPGGRSPAVQQFVGGTCYSVGRLFKNGQALRVCAHRKLVALPPLGGLTVRGVTERPPGLLDEAFKIFELLRYSGLGHAELIRDGEGRYKFIEINPRVWSTIGVAENAGVDFFTPYLELARGATVKPDLRFREGVRFRRMMFEASMIRRRPTRIFGFIRDSLDPSTRSDFRLLDPGPHAASWIAQGLGIRSPGVRGRSGRGSRAAIGT